MTTFIAKGKIDKNGVLKIKHPAFTLNKEIEVTITFEEEKLNKYDFSDLAGKLSWKGDALAFQKTLRNDW
jgi:ribosomal protein S4